jgi:hypothetical protein
MSIQISDITMDPTLSPAEKQSLTKFRSLVEAVLESQNPPGSDWKNISMFQLCESVGVDLSSLAKEGQMLSGLWVIVLRGIRKYMKDEDLKYPTFESFEAAYEDAFPKDDESEKRKLWQVANWMHVLFHLVPAKKNKGLSMLVAPRFVEGWHVKYVTGSGQTHYTANRVKIFEIEGETKAAHRGKLKTKPKKKGSGTPGGQSLSDGSDDGSGTYTMQNRDISLTAADYAHPRKRKVTTHPRREFSADSAISDSLDIRRSKRAKADMARMPPPPIPGRCTTDVLRSASNEDCREAYKEFQSTGVQRDETALLIPDLLRSDSWVNSNAANVPMPLPVPSERNITWGEIPVTNSFPIQQNSYGGMNSLSNLGSISLGSVFMNPTVSTTNIPVIRPETSDVSSVFDGGSPPPNNVFGVEKLSEVFGGFLPAGYQMSVSSQHSN